MSRTFPSSQRSIQSCPAAQLHNSKEVGRTKTKDLSSYFLERGGARAAPGWSARRSVVAGLLLRLRPAGLARRATPSPPRFARRSLPSSARRGMFPSRFFFKALLKLVEFFLEAALAGNQ